MEPHTLIEMAKEIIDTHISEIHSLFHMCIEVSRLGKGLKEAHYHAALCQELQEKQIQYTCEEAMPVMYKGVPLGGGLSMRLDICLRTFLPAILELKAIKEKLGNEHYWQVLRYMDYKKLPLGVLINYSQSEKGQLDVKFVVRVEKSAFLYDHRTELMTPIDDPAYT